MSTDINDDIDESARAGRSDDGPIRDRSYTDARGRIWTFDPASLGHDGQASFRHILRAALPPTAGVAPDPGESIEVFGPDLTSEDQMPGWSVRLEAADVTMHRTMSARALAARLETERVAEVERIEAERIEAERVEAERVEAERVEAERVEAALAIAAEEARAEEERAAEREAEAVADDPSADEAPVSTDRPDAEPLLSTDPPPAVDDPPKEG